MTQPPSSQSLPEDPYIWLEDTYSQRALDWVEAENAASAARLEAEPTYQAAYDEAFAIVSSEDRIATPGFRHGMIYNFWKDGDHLRGIWRRTTLASYRSDAPEWETVLDIDALGKEEGRSWVYKGVTCLRPEDTRCLLRLSDGGEDAVEIREFDLRTKSFVESGFFLPKGKSDAVWLDEDTLLVSTDFAGDGADLTSSGYPNVVKRLKRGQPLSDAVELFRGEREDVSSSAAVLRDNNGNVLPLIVRAPDFWNRRFHLLDGDDVTPIALPSQSSTVAMIDSRVVVHLSQDWSVGGKTFEQGSIVSITLDDLRADPANLSPRLVWAPGPSEAFESVTNTANRLVLSILDNVSGRILTFTPLADGGWEQSSLDLPGNLSIHLVSSDEDSDLLFLNAKGFTTPDTLTLVDAASGETEVVKSLPAKFDASDLVVEQKWATSTDGTKIPYFLVHKKDVKMDGTTPTLLYGYGGFQVSMTPGYSAIIGKLWLEKGGAYALSNIRGGGEFGPAWHKAGLETKRQIIYDDFAAIAEDLIDSGLTSRDHLGMMGGSNGGLLTGVEMTQRPDLWNAAVIQVPLLDMIGISRIGAGASWQGEYGNVNTDPEALAFWLERSPYHALKAGTDYPVPFIYSSTKDDRTGSAHARKFAARMKELGLPYEYFEQTEGGHAAGADPKQEARSWALTYTYLTRQLMGE
nr:prolyl oligopeptidase family serine peptidase [Croceicoccus gelatinilyticus]